jgi:hypothetical protein
MRNTNELARTTRFCQLRFGPMRRNILFPQPHDAHAYVTIYSMDSGRYEAGVVVCTDDKFRQVVCTT